MDQDTNASINNLFDFLHNNMITKDEVEQRISDLPTKADFNQLQISVDGIAKQFNDHNQERVIGAHRSTRMETWIKNAAKKIGVDYEP